VSSVESVAVWLGWRHAGSLPVCEGFLPLAEVSAVDAGDVCSGPCLVVGKT
jgi:hypothetical protein